MPQTGVSVLPNEPEFLEEWAERVADDWHSREERAIRRQQYAVSDDAGAAVRGRSGAAFRERKATNGRVPSTPAPVGAPLSADRPRPVQVAPRTADLSRPRQVRAPRTADLPRPRQVQAPRTADRPRPADPPARRTITIRGQVADRYNPASRRRSDLPRHERPGFRPDRVAMWAVMLGFILVLVAATSAHAAILLH